MFAHNTEEVTESDEYGEADFDAEVNTLFTLKTSTLNMCTQSVQLKIGLINKSPMGVHAHYRNICHQTFGQSKVCAQVSTKTLQFTQICSDSKMLVPLVLRALLSVQMY